MHEKLFKIFFRRLLVFFLNKIKIQKIITVQNLARPSLQMNAESGFVPNITTYILKSNFNPSTKRGL